jgi:hypothetical protein
MDENMCLLGAYLSNNLQCTIKIPDIPEYYNSTVKEILDVLGLHDRVKLVEPPVTSTLSEPMWQVTENKVLFYRKLKDALPNYLDGPEKIFIKRTWGKGSGGHATPIRRIVNEDELQEHLESNGFVAVVFDGLSFAKKKKLLQNAKEVITQTGANCVNLFLCEKLEKLTLLTNDVFRMGGYFVQLWMNVHQRSVSYRELSFKSIDRHLLTGPRGTPNGEDNGNFYVRHVLDGSPSGHSLSDGPDLRP